MRPLACVEVGGSGCQTIVFDDDAWHIEDGATCPTGAELAMAVPGIIEGRRVRVASNLGWYDVDPAEQLGLPHPALVVLNDAEAAALGEAALRAAGGVVPAVTFVGLGTGVGGAVVADGQLVAANLFGHASGYSDATCRCGRVGCLETVAAGWALPTELEPCNLTAVAEAVASAIESEPTATPGLVVVGGGLAGAHPELVEQLAGLLPDRRVERSAAPPEAKSASAWGLRYAVAHISRADA